MNQSIIEHRANYYYVEFREDFLRICEKSSYKNPAKKKSTASAHCKALILSIMESWTNTKKGQGKELFVHMSCPQWAEAMYGMFGRMVIIDSLEELIGEGFLARSTAKMKGRDSFKYLLNCTLVNERIKALPERDPHTTLPKVDASKNGRVDTDDPSKSGPATRPKVDATRPKVDDDPSKSGPFIDRDIPSSQIPHTESPDIYDSCVPTQATDQSSPSVDLTSLNLKMGTGEEELTPHPEHDFIWFDDLETPTLMIIKQTPPYPHPHWAPMEDERRMDIACEIVQYLHSKYILIKTRIEYEEEQIVMESSISPSREDEPPVVGSSDQGSRKNPKKVVGKSDLQETGIQERSDGPHVPAQVTGVSSSSQQKKTDLLSLATPEVQTLVAEWKVCHRGFYQGKKPFQVNRTLISHAETLVKHGLLPGELAGIVGRMLDNDRKGWYAEHGLHLGNVVNWVVLHPSERERVITEPEPIEPLTRATYDALDAKMKAEYPSLFTMPFEADSLLYLVMWYGPGDLDCRMLRDSIDWEYMREERNLMEQAMKYGEALADQRVAV